MKKNEKLRELFENTIDAAIKLKLALDVHSYQEEKHLKNYSDFEEELSIDYPIRGTGVNFSAEIFANWKSSYDNGILINSEKLIESSEITETLAWNPLNQNKMVLVYVFAMLEDFGNSIMEIVAKDKYAEYASKDRSWHSGVNKYAKEKGHDLVEKFGEPFNLETSDINPKFVDLLYDLKQKRNSITHELIYPEGSKFETDFESLLILICYLFHLNDTSKEDVNYFPWHDWEAEMN